MRISIEPLAQQVHQAKRAGKKQKDVAEDIGVTPQYLSDVLRGRFTPGLEFIQKCCCAFGCRIEDIIKMEEE